MAHTHARTCAKNERARQKERERERARARATAHTLAHSANSYTHALQLPICLLLPLLRCAICGPLMQDAHRHPRTVLHPAVFPPVLPTGQWGAIGGACGAGFCIIIFFIHGWRVRRRNFKIAGGMVLFVGLIHWVRSEGPLCLAHLRSMRMFGHLPFFHVLYCVGITVHGLLSVCALCVCAWCLL